MSKVRRARDFLLDIEDAIGRILEYTAGMNWDGYLLAARMRGVLQTLN